MTISNNQQDNPANVEFLIQETFFSPLNDVSRSMYKIVNIIPFMVAASKTTRSPPLLKSKDSAGFI